MDKKHLPPAEVMASVDVQELNRLFVNSGRLDSEAIVQFVKTLSAIAAEELRPVACPRVFSLAKIVEIAHFNMGRIRWVLRLDGMGLVGPGVGGGWDGWVSWLRGLACRQHLLHALCQRPACVC